MEARMKLPLWVAPKIHGVHCEILAGQPLTQDDLHPKVQQVLGGLPPMTGYLVVGPPDAPDVYERSLAVFEQTGVPDFTFYVHDCKTAASLMFKDRLPLINSYVNSCGEWVQATHWVRVEKKETFDAFERSMKELGYHGVLTRYPDER